MTNKEKVEKLKKEEIEKQKRMSALYELVFNRSDEGREVFADLMDSCMTFRQTMTGNSWTYFNEGKRSIGTYLLNMRELGWEELILLKREENSKIKEEN